jgi:hypothetical protein
MVQPSIPAAAHVAAGLVDGLAGVVRRTTRPVIRLVEPPVAAVLGPPLHALAEAFDRAADAAIPAVMEAVMSHVDVDELVREHVDINQIATSIDVDAIVKRVDLVGLAEYVIDEVDLPEIIRQSSTAVTSGAVRGVRIRSMEADQAITRVVDRLRLRHRDHDGESGTPE